MRSGSAPTAAVIGVGRMGLRHLRALAAAGVDAIAVADTEERALDSARREHPRAAAYRDVHLLLREHRPDLVSVATTAPSRAAVVSAAAAAGVPRILCEKPLATSLSEGRSMLEECRRHGTRLVVNHARRVLPLYVAIHRAIREDRFGELRAMRFTCGVGGLGNLGSHAFDLMRWFFGDAVDVTGHIDAEVEPNPRGAQYHDPGGYGTFRFTGGRRATFDFSGDFSSSARVEFICRYGDVLVDERLCDVRAAARSATDRREPLWRYQTPTEPVPLRFGDPVDLVTLTTSMVKDALADSPPVCSGDDGLAALQMVAAVHLAERANCAVPLPLHDDGGHLARLP